MGFRSLDSITRELKDSYRKNRGDVQGFIHRHYPDFILSRRATSIDGQIIVFAFHVVEPLRFEAQLRYLTRNRYHVLSSADECCEILQGRQPLQPQSVLLTFDDGGATLYSVAFPLLKKYGYRAVSFVVPDFVGRPRFCTWDQLREMHESGVVDIQSHTYFHRFAPRWPHVVGCLGMPAGMHHLGEYPTMLEDYRRSKEVIETQLKSKQVRHLCYPDYEGTPESVAASKAAGYVSNFWGVIPGQRTNRVGDDPYQIVRVVDDYLRRLPGKGRESLLTVAARRIQDYSKPMVRRVFTGKRFIPAAQQVETAS